VWLRPELGATGLSQQLCQQRKPVDKQADKEFVRACSGKKAEQNVA
jgi:hypothetical protein